DEVLAMLDRPAVLRPDPRRGDTFLDLVIEHTLEGCFAVPEYGGNHRRGGWKMIGLEGDDQPLGYSIFSRQKNDYNERADHPMTTPNPVPGFADPTALPCPLPGNDELNYAVRNCIFQDPFLEPRTFRGDATSLGDLMDDVNSLPKAVGGAFQHADCKTPRFNAVDFRLKSAIEALIGATPGLVVPGFNDPASPAANFADWPFTYDDLEPFYVEAERLYGTQGNADSIYESRRSQPYPTPAGLGMYMNLLIADAAKEVSVTDIGALNPHTYPA